MMSDLRADLHIHTYYSDSSMSPQNVVREAKKARLACISITDHDTVDAMPEAFAEGRKLDIEIIAGVELSSEHGKKDVHVLGYGFELKKSPLALKLNEMQDARMARMKKMVARLNSLGFPEIRFEDVASRTRSNAVGRLHLAQLLVEKKVVTSIEMAFEKYLGEGETAYFAKFKQTPAEAIRLIKSSGGAAVLAHPMLTGRDEIIPELVKAGLDGLEAYYPNCSMEVANFYVRLAAKNRLIITGGSDAHGAGKKNTYIGKGYLPYEYVAELKKRIHA
ncbi:MAG: PHP domain-containing protein [Candidatus Omnitrophica bacterium]|nr:PHP domain-containing protein [Candidatus Omnitrophota bacterium]